MKDYQYTSAVAMFPLPMSVWPKDNIKWLAQRCAFLVELRHKRNEFFHGGDPRQGHEFMDEINGMCSNSFMPELENFMQHYPDLYNEIWYDRFFADSEE